MASGAQWQVATLLALAWTLTVLYGEWLQYLVHAPLCRDLLPHRSGVRRMDRAAMAQHHTVAVLSTPQLMLSSGRAVLAYQIRSDLQLRRKFRSSILQRANPNVVVVLGDLFSSTPPLSGKQWETSIMRYKHIFDPVIHIHGTRRSVRKKRNIPRVIQIPGPTDVLFSSSNLTARNVYFSQLSHAFSLDLNFVESLGDSFNLVGINSAAADGNRSSHHTRNFWTFVEHARETMKGGHSIALSPLPISTPMGSSCFSLRHSYWLQTQISSELSKNSTSRVISSLRPEFFITGGHEGETCWQAMQAPAAAEAAAASKTGAQGKKDEPDSPFHDGQILLGSFNPTQAHASAPFLLISTLVQSSSTHNKSDNSTAKPVLQMQLCVTPSQFGLLIWNYFLMFLSIAALLLTPTRGPSPFDELQKAANSFRNQFKKAKLKSDDGHTSYDEVVDAEGNFILVPRMEVENGTDIPASNNRTAGQRDDGPQHRTKHHQHDSIDAEAGEGGDLQQGPGPIGIFGALPPKPPTSSSSSVLSFSTLRSRLFGAAGPFLALVACQLALYLGLLASDWA